MSIILMDSLTWPATGYDFQGRYFVYSPASFDWNTINPAFPGERHLHFYEQAFKGLRTRPFTNTNVQTLFGSLRLKRYNAGFFGRNTGIEFFDDGTAQVTLSWTPDGSLQAKRGNNPSGTVLGTAANVCPFDAWNSFQWKIVVHPTAGSIEVRVNGLPTPILNLTGINTRASANNRINGALLFGDGASVSMTRYHLRDWIMFDDTGMINNTWTGDIRMSVLVPNGVGSSTGFETRVGAATNWQAVANLPNDGETSYVQTATLNATDLYTMSDLPVPPSRIVAIRPFGIMRKTDAGTRVVGLRIKSGATETTSGIEDSLGQTFRTADGGTLTTDPNTGAAWTASAVNAIEAGPKIEL